MAKTTKLTLANAIKSLRTTVPMTIIKQFNLNEDSILKWSAVAKNNVLVIHIKPISHQHMDIKNSKRGRN